MSISSTSNTLSSPSSSSSANSTPQPSSLRATSSTSSTSSVASPILDCDRLINGEGDDDDNIFRTKTTGTTPAVEVEEASQEQASKGQKTSITSNDKRSDKLDVTRQKTRTIAATTAKTTSTPTCKSSTPNSLLPDSCSSEKITASAVTFSSQCVPDKRLSVKLETVSLGTPTILKRAGPVQLSSVENSKSNIVITSDAGRPPQVSVRGGGGGGSSQHSASRWKLGTKLETTCNILSKSSAASAIYKSSTVPARSDLLASSSSTSMPTHTASQVINFKTLPLLMHHNHHFQTSTSLTASEGNCSNGTTSCSSSSSNSGSRQNSTSSAHTTAATTPSTAKPLVPTLTPQLILSQIITANPNQRPSHLQTTLTSASLDGIQFCLANATNSGAQANTKVLQVQSLAQSSGQNTSSSRQVSAIASSTTQPTGGASGSPSKQARDGAPERTPKSVAAQPHAIKSSGPDGDSKNTDPGAGAQVDGSPGNNIAAARLLDLGKKLLEATREGKLDQVRHLVEDSGAPFTSDWLGTTALHLAAQGGYADIAEVLVRAGVNRDARTKLERTALHLAAQSGSLEIVDLLLTHGSDVNARDMLRMTPLHWAVERGHVYVAERLLISGADAELSNKFLLKPKDIARELGSFEMIELFKNWAGDGKDDQNLEAYSNNPGAALNESQDFLDLDYHLALVDSATNSLDASMDELDANGDPCIDLVEFEWNKFDFDPDLFLPNESNEDEQKVDFLMKVVEDLKKENQLLRQKVEQLSTVDE